MTEEKDRLAELLKRLGISGHELQGARLGPGVVGRNSSIAWGVGVVMLAGVLCGGYLHSLVLAGASIFGGLIIGVVVPWFNVVFAKQNPAAALLEGAHFVEYHQMQMAAAKDAAPDEIAGPPVPAPRQLQNKPQNSLPERKG
jgi:hypothetical protein